MHKTMIAGISASYPTCGGLDGTLCRLGRTDARLFLVPDHDQISRFSRNTGGIR